MAIDYKQKLFDFWDMVKKNNDAGWKYGVDPTGWRKESHINYYGDYHPMHVLNLYYPESWDESQGKLPTIVYIHGGGWLYGTVDDGERYLGWLASQGYAVMAMNYRLLQETDLQGLVSDIFAAMGWLTKHGPARGFDLSKVLVTGDSAGGHLTLLTTCIQQSEKLQQIYKVEPFGFSVSALAISCPCVETDTLYINGAPGTEEGEGTAKAYRDLMLGEDGEDAPWRDYMSFSQASKGLKLPPILLIGSESESLYAQSCFLMDYMKDREEEFETLVWKKEDGPHLVHVFNISNWEWRESLISNRRMLEFFSKNIK